MNSTHKPVVVTDPVALDTIFALRAIKVGDWLRAANWHPSYDANGRWFRVITAKEDAAFGWMLTVAFRDGRTIPLRDERPGLGQSRCFFDGWMRDE